MSDFVTTQVKASKEIIDSMINMVPGHELEGHVDFNCLLPVPDDIYQGNVGPKEKELYGTRNWIDWNVANWGTKWNARDTFRKSDKSVYFTTAWGNPQPALRALSKKFPDQKILIRQAGETNYYWSGSYILLNGVVTKDPKGPNVMDIDSINRFASKVRNRKFA